MTTVSIYQDNTGRVHISDGNELWAIDEIPTSGNGEASSDAKGWAEGYWTPTPGRFTRVPLNPIKGQQEGGLRLIAAWRAGQLHINYERGKPVAGEPGRRYLGYDETERP